MAREADDPRLRAEEARLARRAADGDGAAFATLYDRYEQRIYTFSHRLVGNDQDAADATQDAFVKVLQRLPKLGDRDLNFGAYLFTAARNASYDVIGKRKRADAVEEIPEYGSQPVYGEQGDRLDLDPEGAAMLGALQDQVRAANARLPERQREVLALRELEELSYDEIAAMMGMNRNSVAQLISRARIKLRDELRGSALAAVAAATPDDQRAAALIAERMDGELTDDDDRAWLEDYLRDNERGRAMVECMLEAGTSYRAWLPIVPVVWLREATMAKAAEAVGADWSGQVAESTHGDAAGSSHSGDVPGADGGAGGSSGANGAGGAGGTSGAGGAGGMGGTSGESGGGAAGAGAASADAEGQASGAAPRRRRGAVAGAIAGVLLLLVLGSQLVVGGGDTPQSAAVVTTAGAADESAATTATGGALAEPETTAKANGKKAKAKGADEGAADATGTQVVTAADGSTTVIRRLEQPGGGSSSPKRSTSTGKKKSSSGGKKDEVSSSGGSGSGSGKQGEGSAPLPADPQPAPQPEPTPTPTPEPTPQPEPAPTPTAPTPTTPPTRTTPTRTTPPRIPPR